MFVGSLALFGLLGAALAGSASAATAKSCGSWHSPAGTAALHITASGVSCHYAKSKFLTAYNNGGHVPGWKVKYGSSRSSHGYTIQKTVATKGSDKITFHWKQPIA
jgi:hypothetical protein